MNEADIRKMIKNMDEGEIAETVISEGKRLMGDRFDFSKAIVKKLSDYVLVIDKEHGEYAMSAIDILKGKIPTKTSIGLAVTARNYFIKRATHRYGEIFNYSHVNYKDAKTKVYISHPEKGLFTVNPKNFLDGIGVPQVSEIKEIKNQERLGKEWKKKVVKLRAIHGKYCDYSKVVYKGVKEKVIVIDKEYGEFEITVVNHMNGSVHPLRSKENRKASVTRRRDEKILEHKRQEDKRRAEELKLANKKERRRIKEEASQHRKLLIKLGLLEKRTGTPRTHVKGLSKEKFVERANLVHNSRYDYSKTVYEKLRGEITVIDPEFGEFTVIAADHIAGKGHPKFRKKNRTMDLETFIAEAKAIHGNIYDYSKAEWNGIVKKLKIVHPDLGEFMMTPEQHLKGGHHPKLRRLNNMQFFAEAERLYGNRYDYSQTKFVSAFSEIIVIHPVLGPFKTTPAEHIWLRREHPKLKSTPQVSGGNGEDLSA